MLERDVAGPVGREREGDADQLRAGRVGAAGFGVHRDPALGRRVGDPAVEGVEIGDRLVPVMVAGRVVVLRHRVGGDDRRVGDLAEAREQRPETVMLQKGAQRRFGNALQLQLLERMLERRVALQLDQLAAEPRVVGVLAQIVAQLALLELVGRGRREHALDVAMVLDQLGGRLRPDAGHAGDVVDRVAHQREHVAELVGADAELLLHIVRPEPPVVHRVEHVDRRLGQELHQVLVARHDRDRPALRQRRLGIGRDQVVGLQPLLLDAGQREGAGGVADHRKLRDQVLGRRRAVRLVLVVHLVAEGVRRLVEHDRHVGRPLRLVQVVGQLPEHGGVAVHGPHRLAVLVGERRQAVIGAEDVARAVDEIEMGHRLAA
jgi:hypothetical protein